MSRKKSQEELDAEMEAEDAAMAANWKKQEDCGHYYSHPVEWHWSGKVRVMHCDDCGKENFIDEVV